MIVYNYDADLEVSDTCVRSSLLSWVELSTDVSDRKIRRERGREQRGKRVSVVWQLSAESQLRPPALTDHSSTPHWLLPAQCPTNVAWPTVLHWVCGFDHINDRDQLLITTGSSMEASPRPVSLSVTSPCSARIKHTHHWIAQGL